MVAATAAYGCRAWGLMVAKPGGEGWAHGCTAMGANGCKA